jgi:7-cyano-7-deazaguanine synthase
MSKAVVVYSGGMDSTVLLEYCIKNHDEVYVITFDYNQRHKKEIAIARSYVEEIHSIMEHKVVDLKFFADLVPSSAITSNNINVPKMKDIIGEAQSSAYVPNRNMMLLSIACSYAEAVKASDVYYGAVAIDNLSGYWDCTEQFVDGINNLLALNRMNRIQIQAPLLFKSKKEIIEMGIELGVKFNRTWTCYEGRDISCGECPSCAARLGGWVKAGYIDPLLYEKHIDWDTKKCKPLLKYKNVRH